MPLPEPAPDVASLDLLRSVAELGSISRAAAAHRMSQPAASMRLRALERQVGIQLMERQTTGTRLTPAGETVVEWAVPVLEGIGELVAGLASLRGSARPELRLAASMTVAEYLAPAWLARLARRSPRVAVSLRMGNSQQVTTMMQAGEADLGFVEGVEVPKDLRWATVAHDDIVIVVAPGHPWSRRRQPVDPEELANAPLVARESGSGTRAVIERALAEAGQTPTIGVELGSTTAIKAAVLAGAGVTGLGKMTVRGDLEEGRLVQVPTTGLDFHRSIRALWRRDRNLLGPAERLLAAISGPTPTSAAPPHPATRPTAGRQAAVNGDLD